MSVLPISRKRPPRGRRSSEASTNSPARALRTTSTPSPSVASRNLSLNSRSREEAMWSSARPASRSTSHLAGLAVAKTSAPRWRASWIAAMPTPPAPAWIRTFSPAFSPARSLQAVVGGGEDDRHRRGLLEGPALGDRDEQVALAGGERAEGVGDQAHHPVSGGEVVDLGADLDDHARRPRCRSAPRPGRRRGRSARRGS